jgi:hypothetical protein
MPPIASVYYKQSTAPLHFIYATLYGFKFTILAILYTHLAKLQTSSIHYTSQKDV